MAVILKQTLSYCFDPALVKCYEYPSHVKKHFSTVSTGKNIIRDKTRYDNGQQQLLMDSH